MRADLKMPKGKLAAQVAHASLEAALKAPRFILEQWREEGAKKVVLKVQGLQQLRAFARRAEKLPNALITDRGNTFFKGPTVTCLGIGPSADSEIDELTGELPLL